MNTRHSHAPEIIIDVPRHKSPRRAHRKILPTLVYFLQTGIDNRKNRYRLLGHTRTPSRGRPMGTVAEQSTKLAPPYVSYPAFRSFIDKLSDSCPDVIDRSIMTTMSGGTQAQMLSSLKFLELTSDDCRITEQLRSLISAKPLGDDAFRMALKEVAIEAYSGVIGDFDLMRMTPKQLADRFREAGAEGSTLVKAIRFYLHLLDECEVAYPKHFSQASRSANPPVRRTERKAKQIAEIPAAPTLPETGAPSKPKTQEHLPIGIRIPIPTADDPHRVAVVPSDLNEADCKYLEVMIKAIADRITASRTNPTRGAGH